MIGWRNIIVEQEILDYEWFIVSGWYSYEEVMHASKYMIYITKYLNSKAALGSGGLHSAALNDIS